MAEEYDAQRTHECEAPVVREEGVEVVEVKDRGIFDFLVKKDGEEKEEKDREHGRHHQHHHDHKHHHGEGVKEEKVIAAEFEEKANICEGEKLKGEELEEVKEEKKKEKKEKKKKHKLGGSDSSSSSSSDEEEDKEKKKKEKEKKKKEKEEKKEEEKRIEGTAVPVEKCGEEVLPPAATEEKKGFLEKIKEKIPVVGGQAKKSEEVAPPLLPPPSDFDAAAMEAHPPCEGGEPVVKEKKGILEKIKEKIPGYHHKSHEEEKEKEKEKEEKESAAST